MEIETLVSMIRHMRAKEAALTCMDEVLTVVMEAEQRVKAAEKAVTNYEAELGRLKEVEDARSSEHAAKVTKLDEELAAKQVDALAVLDAQKADRLAQIARIEAGIDEQLRFHDALKGDCEVVASRLKALVVEKRDLESDVEQVRKQLRDIKESIR